MVQELVRVTCPGGWVELLEASITIFNAGPATEQLYKWMRDACLSRGIDLSRAEEIGKLLTQAGLRQVRQQAIDVPLGAWDAQVGVLMEKRKAGCNCCIVHEHTFRELKWNYFTLSYSRKAPFYSHPPCFLPENATALGFGTCFILRFAYLDEIDP